MINVAIPVSIDTTNDIDNWDSGYDDRSPKIPINPNIEKYII